MDGITFTRRDIRAAIADEMSDFDEFEATEDGTDGTFIDKERIIGGRQRFRGSDVLVVSSLNPANIGQIRRVDTSNELQGVINLRPPLPGKTRKGDKFQAFNLRSEGIRVDQYNRAINNAIREVSATAWQHARIEYLATDITAQNNSVYSVHIPDDWLYLTNVQVGAYGQSDYPSGEHLNPDGSYITESYGTLESDGLWAGQWYDVKWAMGPGRTGYWVMPDDEGGWDLRVVGYPAGANAIAVDGLVGARLLEDDDDTTSVDFRWLVESCKGSLYEARARRSKNGEDDLNQAYASKDAANKLNRGIHVNHRRTPNRAFRLRR